MEPRTIAKNVIKFSALVRIPFELPGILFEVGDSSFL